MSSLGSNVALIGGKLARTPVEQARANGYECLSPVEKWVAIEFATSGTTLKELARRSQRPLAEIKQAFSDPIVRALINDLQNEIAQHKLINAAWVEQQVFAIWPQLIGEEDVNLVNKAGEQVTAKKFHAPEVASILKHFSGNADQKKAGGVNVQINFGDMGVTQNQPVAVDVVIDGEVVK